MGYLRSLREGLIINLRQDELLGIAAELHRLTRVTILPSSRISRTVSMDGKCRQSTEKCRQSTEKCRQSQEQSRAPAQRRRLPTRLGI
jgi:hypothetical protein